MVECCCGHRRYLWIAGVAVDVVAVGACIIHDRRKIFKGFCAAGNQLLTAVLCCKDRATRAVGVVACGVGSESTRAVGVTWQFRFELERMLFSPLLKSCGPGTFPIIPHTHDGPAFADRDPRGAC